MKLTNASEGPLKGTGDGSSPGDNGTQGGGVDFGGSDSALESSMVASMKKTANDSEKEQGYDVPKAPL